MHHESPTTHLADPAIAARQLAAVPLFSELPPAALAALADASRLRHYAKGQVLCCEDDPGDVLFILVDGRVRISRFSPEGQETMLAIMDAPGAFGELALIDGTPRSATITAMTPITVRLIERQAFLALIEREPALSLGLLRSLAAMVRATNERLADLMTLDVPGRLAKWLLEHANESDDGNASLAIPFSITQSDLAVELAATRVSVNKALRMFAAVQAIAIERQRIILLRPALLQQYIQA